MKKLLWVGDAGVPSGFARATHEILDTLRHEYDVTVLGINYRGDPHEYPYPLYAAAPGGDAMGIMRLPWMVHHCQPDVIVIQNDGWNIPYYIAQLEKNKLPKIPIVAAVAVDGKNFDGGWLTGVASAVFWTQFALDEARAGGYKGPADVIPLGVDVDFYQPADKIEARRRRGLPAKMEDTFIVGNVNRNQPRKRWDLTVKYFAEWMKAYDVKDACLYLHTAPTGDESIDVQQLARYYGVLPNLALVEPLKWYGVNEDVMVDTYNSFDVQISTTQGEGFGLTTFEGMACGVPQIVPDWSALGELTRGAARLVPCTSTAVGMPYVNVIGGVADEEQFIASLNDVYRDRHLRNSLKLLGLQRVHESRFRWSSVGERWAEALAGVLSPARRLGRVADGRLEEATI